MGTLPSRIPDCLHRDTEVVRESNSAPQRLCERYKIQGVSGACPHILPAFYWGHSPYLKFKINVKLAIFCNYRPANRGQSPQKAFSGDTPRTHTILDDWKQLSETTFHRRTGELARDSLYVVFTTCPCCFPKRSPRLRGLSPNPGRKNCAKHIVLVNYCLRSRGLSPKLLVVFSWLVSLVG